MLDIHNHTLFGVDDGAESLEISIAMLKEAKKQQIDAVILTPHYRHGMFEYDREKIGMHFLQLCNAADTIGIRIYLGCEYHVDSQILTALLDKKCYTLASSEYVLTEYSFHTEYAYILEYTRRLLSAGYIPVIAHVERYQCLIQKPALCEELQDLGAMIQINADSVLGFGDSIETKVCRKLLRKRWVDIIASDAHNLNSRANHLGQCYEYIYKNYDEEYAQLLMDQNPRRIVAGIE